MCYLTARETTVRGLRSVGASSNEPCTPTIVILSVRDTHKFCRSLIAVYRIGSYEPRSLLRPWFSLEPTRGVCVRQTSISEPRFGSSRSATCERTVILVSRVALLSVGSGRKNASIRWLAREGFAFGKLRSPSSRFGSGPATCERTPRILGFSARVTRGRFFSQKPEHFVDSRDGRHGRTLRSPLARGERANRRQRRLLRRPDDDGDDDDDDDDAGNPDLSSLAVFLARDWFGSSLVL